MIVQGDPVNDAGRRAFELLRSKLDGQAEEYSLCTNISLLNGSNRMSEIDAIVVGPSMIFAIEVKGWNGRVTQQRDGGLSMTAHRARTPPSCWPAKPRISKANSSVSIEIAWQSARSGFKNSSMSMA